MKIYPIKAGQTTFDLDPVIPKQILNYLDVPGFNNPYHIKALMKFASSIPEGSRVLEIGCGWGCTTWALLDSLPENVDFHTCDTFGMNDNALKMHHVHGVTKVHMHNTAVRYAMWLYTETQMEAHRTVFDWVIAQHPKRNKIKHTVHQKTSLKLLDEDANWDVAYIDGLHQYYNVKQELNKLKDVKYLCGDDYHPAHPGCKRAIDEFLESDEREFYHHDFETGSGFWTAVK